MFTTWILISAKNISAQDLRLQYSNSSTNTNSQTIDPHTNLHNDGTSSVTLSDVTIRYWFTSEPPGQDVYEIFWSPIGAGNINGTFGTIGGHRYLEISFTAGAGQLSPGTSTGQMQNRIRDDGWGTYNQSDDYSFDPNITSFTNHEEITVYHQGSLVWGTPPPGAAEAESMQITQQPINSTAGETLSASPAVLLEDGVGNPVEGVEVTVSLNQNNFAGGSVITVQTNASGLAIFDDLTIENANTGYELTFDADAPLVSNITSNSFDVDPAAPASMSISTQPPSSTTAGSALSPAVTMTDTYGNPTPNEDVTVTINKNSLASGTSTISTNSAGVATFSDLVITTAATGYQLTFDADAAGVSNTTSSNFAITSAAASNMTIIQQPLESVVTGVISGPPAAKITDTYGNPVSGVNVTVSETGGYIFDGGTLTRSTNSLGTATFNDLQITTADTDYQLTFNAASGGVSNVNSATFDVVAAGGTMTITTQPNQTVAGTVLSPALTLELKDSQGDPLSGVDITVSLNQDDFDEGTLTKQSNGSGIAEFDDLVIETAGTAYQITFDANQSGVPDVFSSTFDVVAANPTSLSMNTQPSNTAAGSNISGPPTVIITDAFGNPVSGVDISVSVNQNSFTSGTTTLSSGSDGITEFDDLVITTKAIDYQLTFIPDAAGVSNVISNTFNISAGTASNMVIDVQPTAATAGELISPSPKVQITDTYGNSVSGLSVTATLNQNNFSGGSTTIENTNSGGIATFDNLKIGTSGTGYEITFSASGPSPVTSSTFDVTQPNPPFGSIRLQYKNNNTNTTTQTIIPHIRLFNDSDLDINLSDLTVRYWFSSEPPGQDIHALDWVEMGYEEEISGSFDQISGNRYLEIGFSSNIIVPVGLGGDGSTPGLMPSGATTGEIQNRIRDDGWNNYDQSNDYSFDPGITSYTNYDNITIYYKGNLVWGTPPSGTSPAESMSITEEPTNTTAGQVISPSPTVFLEDANGNPVEGVDVTVTLNQNNFTGGSTTIVTSNSSGLAVFNDLTIVTSATGYELTFNADASLVTNKTSAPFVVNPDSPDNMIVSTQPATSTSAGSTLSPSPAVTVVDNHGNAISGVDVTVSLNKNSIASGTTTISTNSSGIAAFNNLVITTASTNYEFNFNADAAGVSNVTSNSFTITSATANSMSITQQPLESVVSGVIAGPPTVTLIDIYGNPVSGVDVTVSETGGYTLDGGTLARTTNGLGVVVFNDLQITTANTDYRLTFDADAFGVSNKTSNFFNVTAPTGSMIVTTQPTETEAGETISPALAVELVDLEDDPISGVDITISVNENNFASGTLTKQTNGSGIATFDDLVIETAGTDYQITFNADQSGVPNVFSNNFDVTSGEATAMNVTTQPGNTPSGIPLSGPPAVIVTDQYGNGVPGLDIVVSLNQNSFSSGTTTVTTNTSGVASFNDIIISTISTGYQLTFDADAAGVSNVNSVNFNITADAPDALEISVQPTESTGGITISPSPTVLVTDAGDNPVPGVNVTATLNKNNFSGGSTPIVTTNSNGLAVFNNLKINVIDTGYELSFSTSTLGPVASSTFDVVQPNPLYGSIRLQYNNNATNTSSQTIQPHIRIFNDSELDIDLSDLTIRYWFTSEPAGQDLFELDWVEMGTEDDLNGTFGEIQGNYYLEISFSQDIILPVGLGGDGSTPDLFPAQASTGVIQNRIREENWNNFDQSDDFSFDGDITNYTDYEYINVYYKGQLVWGISPSISTKYYSRQTGNWNEATNWSLFSHIGAVSTIAPQADDTVVVGNEHIITFVENITNDEVVTIDATGTLHTAEYILSGSGDFELATNGTIGIGSVEGIASSGATGNIQNTGSRIFDPQANYIYNGNLTQITGNALSVQLNGDLTIDNTEGVRAIDNIEVSGILHLINGSLIIESGNNLISNTKNIQNGSLIMERIITGTIGWHLLSSPLATSYHDFLDSTITQGYPDAYYGTGSNPGDTLQPNVLYYDETYPGTDNQRWRAPSSAMDVIPETQGLYTFFFGDIDEDPLYNNVFDFPITLTAQGQENEGDGSKVNFGVTYSTEADSGWNLVGNPYAATIDWDNSEAWTKTNMDNTIYVWDSEISSFKTWNGTAGDLDSQGLIAPFQAFWVKANDENPHLDVAKDAKTFDGVYVKQQSDSRVKRAKQAKKSSPVISLKISSEKSEAATHIMFSDEAKLGKDIYDAYRLIPPPGVSSYLDIYSVTQSGIRFAINNLPRNFGKPIEIPIQVHSYESGISANKQIEITLSEFKNIPKEWNVELIDNSTKTKIDFNASTTHAFKQNQVEGKPAPNLSFGTKPKIITTETSSTARFTLVIDPREDANGLPSKFELKQNYPNPFNPTTKIQFELPLQSLVQLEIFDLLGRKVSTLLDREELTAGSHTFEWNARQFSSGVYFYRLVTPDAVITKKMTLIK